VNETVSETVTARGRIHGRVQGVWFRGFTREQALRTGLSGYARNRSDGSVDFALTGPQAAVEQVISVLHDGPRGARVDRVDVSWHPGEVMSGFEIG
jgi:acylphosphatase